MIPSHQFRSRYNTIDPSFLTQPKYDHELYSFRYDEDHNIPLNHSNNATSNSRTKGISLGAGNHLITSKTTTTNNSKKDMKAITTNTLSHEDNTIVEDMNNPNCDNQDQKNTKIIDNEEVEDSNNMLVGKDHILSTKKARSLSFMDDEDSREDHMIQMLKSLISLS